MHYSDFLFAKSQLGEDVGFDPIDIPDFLFPFQKALVEWALVKGRSAIFADCGLGKTPMQLVWADNVVRKTNNRVLIITPLAVSAQTLREGEKFSISCARSIDGVLPSARIVVTNYERLHYFDSNDFQGVVCDESSAIKHFNGKTQRAVTDFMKKIPYRLLCTATAAPNDFIELGTSSEALGQMGRMDMLGMFFKNDTNSLHPVWWGGRWRFKQHAEQHFWRWVTSWARAVRRPSDLGFDDDDFVLPKLQIRETVVVNTRPFRGQLIRLPAVTLNEQREERRHTLKERCEKVAEILASCNGDSAVVWCHLNAEADLLEQIIPEARQVSGSDSDESKEQKFLDFVSGDLKILVTKPKIGAFGLNWQHCSRMTFFPSHSFEQFYQGVRRCWRFGQKHSVEVDIITTEGELGVLKNLQRKSEQADRMFSKLVAFMNNSLRVDRSQTFDHEIREIPWLVQ